MKNTLFYQSLILFLFISCTNKLEETEANKLISNIENELVVGEIEIWLSGSNYSKESIVNSFKTHNAQLVKKGILSISSVVPFQAPYEPISYSISANLTKEAESLIVLTGDDQYQAIKYLVKCGELKFQSITSIFQENKSNIAEIEYSCVFLPSIFHELAKTHKTYIEGQVYTNKIIAKKHDSGWRLEFTPEQLKIQELSIALKDRERSVKNRNLDDVNELNNEQSETNINPTNSEGWVRMEDVDLVDMSGSEGDAGITPDFSGSKAFVTSSDFLALKSEQNINSKRILKIEHHESIDIISGPLECETIEGEYNCWYKVKYNDMEGYVFGAYIQIE